MISLAHSQQKKIIGAAQEIPCPSKEFSLFLGPQYPASHTGKGKSSADQCLTGCFKNNF